jgi:hypothetical protein
MLKFIFKNKQLFCLSCKKVMRNPVEEIATWRQKVAAA